MDIHVYNAAFQQIAVVSEYKSLIWATRYYETGDCELYLPATIDNLANLKRGYYLRRADSDMICVIRKIELDTDAENGDYLIITGVDVKSWLDQRVVWNTETSDGNAETFMLSLVNNALGSGAAAERQIPRFSVESPQGFAEALTEQVSYKNVGEKIREWCKRYRWGYRVRYINGGFAFGFYAGADRTKTVVFSENYENIATTKYVEDDTGIENVALTVGEGEGADRTRTVSGNGTGIDRYELYVDAKDLSHKVSYADLTAAYPSGSIVYNGGYKYRVATLDIQVIDAAHLAALQEAFPAGTTVTIDGNLYFEITDADIATLETDAPEDTDTVELADVIYTVYLLERGYTALAEYKPVTAFSGAVEPFATFALGKDYFLGDVVTVENSYGITAQARIVEVIEVYDDNGYSIEPKFQYEG